MMTLNEAIEYEKEKAKEQRYYANFEKRGSMVQSCLCKAEEHEQYVEWLEELKANKVSSADIYEQGYKQGYNQALQDLMNTLLEKAPRNYAGELELDGAVKYLSANKVSKAAEQLKINIQNADLQYTSNEYITEEIAG